MSDFHSPEELLAAYDYDLPPEAIAQTPADRRDHSRLLLVDRRRSDFPDCRFADLPGLLTSGDLLVLNDTRVIPARLFGRKIPGGGRLELLLVRDLGGGTWEAMVRSSRRLQAGTEFEVGTGQRGRLVGPREGPHWEVALPEGPELDRLLEEHGHMPLPPYITRPDTEEDRDRYQTVFARSPGAVAAPTAGLHFTPGLFAALESRGIRHAFVTLHVGPGTFRPLDSAALETGRLHREWYHLPAAAAASIDEARAAGGRIVAVGTTTTRVLESCAEEDGTLSAGSGCTRLFIRPPYRRRVVDQLITNFHLPRSSLLMLVAAFADRERILAAYREALSRGFRFYSYGDAMLIR